jgi:ADP-ribose pyrophosphatase YjhB (NUDIX family)
MHGNFNIRVYGIIIQNQCVLMSDEYINGKPVTKFPGGGLKFGEGTIDCIKRELQEELNSKAEDIVHFYTTDFFQRSAFNYKHQIISIYYRINKIDLTALKTTNKKFDFNTTPTEGEQRFRWVKLSELDENECTFPIDKKIISMLKSITALLI